MPYLDEKSNLLYGFMAGVLIGLCLYMSPASNVFHTVSTERRAL